MVEMKKNNPLNKRFFKEFKDNFIKYFVISTFLILIIGFISGVYVANNSMLSSHDKNKLEYAIEHGHFKLEKKADSELIRAIESGKKSDLKAYLKDKAYEKIDEELAEKFKSEFDEKFEEGLREEIESQVDLTMNQLPQVEFLSDADRENLRNEEINTLFNENIKTAKNSEGYKEAYDKAFGEAKRDARKEADENVDKEYEKLNRKFDLKNPNFKETPVRIYELFYKNVSEYRPKDDQGEANVKNGKIRVYKIRDEINIQSIMAGQIPVKEDEIAIDRMHAENTNLKVGDKIKVGGKEFKIVGLIAIPDYATLHEKTNEMIFDSIGFDVAVVTEKGFSRINGPINYNYAFTYSNNSVDKKAIEIKDNSEKKKFSEDFLAVLISQTIEGENKLEEFIPSYANPAINFAYDDLGSDKAMGGVLFNVFIVIIAFIFAVTINNTIEREAKVIGTLRASGYTKKELLHHYMALPVIVTLISAIIGNILGYTYLKNVVVEMYYNSYSLGKYETFVSYEALIKTTIIPIIMMFVINYVIIRKKLELPTLNFLRGELKKKKNRRAIKLPNFSFLRRFRLRVIFQNAFSYIILFLGVMFIMIMMTFTVGFTETFEHYAKHASEMLFVKNQVILKDYRDENENIITTKAKDAEKIGVNTLIRLGEKNDDEIQTYGIVDNSKYVKLENVGENEVYISSAYGEKFSKKIGDTIELNGQYDKEKYKFKIKGVIAYDGALAVFMPINNFNKTFDKDADSFMGYMANEKITDIDKKYIAAEITQNDIQKVAGQMYHSVGNFISYFEILLVALSILLIYLLTKLIIEKNENSISMIKILGYKNSEIARLYLLATTIFMIISLSIMTYISKYMVGYLFIQMLQDMDGFFKFKCSLGSQIRVATFMFAAYLVVMIIDYYRIKKIPMDKVIKDVE